MSRRRGGALTMCCFEGELTLLGDPSLAAGQDLPLPLDWPFLQAQLGFPGTLEARFESNTSVHWQGAKWESCVLCRQVCIYMS